MRVRAIAKRLTPAQRETIGGGLAESMEVRVGVEHLVLGLVFAFNSRTLGSGVWIVFEDVAGNAVQAPLALFEVVDPHPSRHWEFRQFDDSAALWPPVFDRPHFFGDVGDGAIEARKELAAVRELLERKGGA